MDKKDLAKRLLAAFLEELHQHVESMNRDFLALEKNPPQAEQQTLLNSSLRTLHCIKGAARAVENAAPIADACHQMEDILQDVKREQRPLTGEICSLLFRSADAFAEAGMLLRSDQELTDAAVHQCLALLSSLADRDVDSQPVSQPVSGADFQSVNSANGPPAQESVGEDASDNRSPRVTTGEISAGEICDDRSPAGASVTIAGILKSAPPASTKAITTPIGPATIRVPAEKLDRLLSHSGELLIAQSRVETRADMAQAFGDALARFASDWKKLEEPLRCLMSGRDNSSSPGTLVDVLPGLSRQIATIVDRAGGALQQLGSDCEHLVSSMREDRRILADRCKALNDEVHNVRMLPFAEACGGLERLARDVAQTTGKRIRFQLQGADVEVDRSVLEGLKDPLMHLLRNAIDHGLESPEARAAAGKPAEGTVTVSAELRGGNVEVVVGDDGGGLDLARIRNKAIKNGWEAPEDNARAKRLIFVAGFSTATSVTDVSGRGVGLDVVQNQIESLHGSVDVDFQAGVGTRFHLTVPLTLTTIRCLLAGTGGTTYAIPTSAIDEIVRFDASSIRVVGGREMLLRERTPIPLASLPETLGEALGPRNASGKLLAVILMAGDKKVAFLFDELEKESEVLVKHLGARVRRVRHFSGATLLPSGGIALVLNVPNIVRSALGIAPTQSVSFKAQDSVDVADADSQKRLLVAEDSLTTRMLITTILETAGYDVIAAVDGQQAWETLQKETVDLVVSDVDMPRMSGYELVTAIRGQAELQDLPVILLTSRGTDEDKERGLEVGANDYIVKSSFDQRSLLESIEHQI